MTPRRHRHRLLAVRRRQCLLKLGKLVDESRGQRMETRPTAETGINRCISETIYYVLNIGIGKKL